MNKEVVKHLLTSDDKFKHWGYGEWIEEPDLIIFFHKNIECQIVRMTVFEGPNKEFLSLGHLCGYIEIPDGHPWTDKENGDINADVHGGITYSGRRNDNTYLIGFDCAHSMDIIPSSENFRHPNSGIREINKQMAELRKKFLNPLVFNRSYKNIDFVRQQCIYLAEQALATKTT